MPNKPRPGPRRRLRQPVLIGALAAAFGLAFAVGAAATPSAAAEERGWTVYHGDAAGTGVVRSVKSVDTSVPAWISPTLDGQIYGEPLVVSGRVYVATENDTVYALAVSSGKVIWSRHLGSPVPSGSLPCGDITPEVGITGTPVIDEPEGELFVVADESVSGSPAHRLYGISLSSGSIKMAENVDPAGSDPAALLQRTALTLDAGKVVFGFGGNYGDCSAYHGWVVAVSESGGTPAEFEIDAAAGEREGAVWMGGGAPAIDGGGNIWVEVGNGSVTSSAHAYDDSDSVLELSPSLQLLQYFAPSSWASDNARDADLSMEPAFLPNGQVLAAGKSDVAYLLSRSRLGGIGGQETAIGSICGAGVDGGSAVVGSTVYLPCLSGITAIEAGSSPPSLRVRWSSATGGGFPIVAAGRVWTIGQDGELYGLDPASGRILQRAAIGAVASHFPTPSLGDGLLLAPAAYRVTAFRAVPSRPDGPPMTSTTAAGATSSSVAPPTTSAGTATTRPPSHHGGLPAGAVAGIVVAGVAAGAGLGWLLARRRRLARR